MEIQEIRDMIFGTILLCAAWQDWRKRSISFRLLVSAGFLGVVLAFAVGRSLGQILLSSAIGICLLGLSKGTRGGIGTGDGWFFVVSGLYLSWKENLALFLSGLFLCFFVSLFLLVGKRRGRRSGHRTIPFLLLLLPGGMGLLLAKGAVL